MRQQTYEVPAEQRFDGDRAEAFSERLLGALNDGALCLMV